MIFFAWYNAEHHHSSLGLLTPDDVHHGRSAERIEARNAVLALAYAAHPERFVGGMPKAPAPPSEVWINRPKLGAGRPPEAEARIGDPPKGSPAPELPRIDFGAARPAGAPCREVAH